MTAYLVDTHAVLWFLTDDRQLSPSARQTMLAPENVLLISAASTWEIAIKAGLGKLDAPDDLPDLIRAQGFDELPISSRHAWHITQFAGGTHKDPFDRLLAAQAIVEHLPIISSDRELDQYGIRRHW